MCFAKLGTSIMSVYPCLEGLVNKLNSIVEVDILDWKGDSGEEFGEEIG